VRKLSLSVLVSCLPARAPDFCEAQSRISSATGQGIFISGTAYRRQWVLCCAAFLLVAGTNSGARSPQTVSLNASGGLPVSLSPSSLSFSGQIVNTTSGAKTVNLKNRQAVPLTITSISVTGDFAQTNNCPFAPLTLAKNASCTLSITFAPTSLGTRTGTLVIADDASTSPQSVPLSGSGTLSGLSAITVTPGSASINKGSQQQFTATGTFSGGLTSNITNFVTWQSSNPVVATVNSTGLTTALSPGTATIQASSGTISGSATLVVASSYVLQTITVTPSAPSIAKGQTQQFMATGTYSDGSTQNLTTSVTWSSSSQGVATISSAGLAMGTGVGTTNVGASLGAVSGSTTLTVTAAALVSIAVTPSNPSIALGTNQQFTATGNYTDGSTLNLTGSVAWNSSAPAVATISNTAPNIGQATSVATGQTTITATSGSISVSTTLTVTPATLLSITVTPATPTIPLGSTKQFTAIGTYTDGSAQDLSSSSVWSSSDTTIFTVNTTGLAVSVGTGTARITATANGVSGSTNLTVIPVNNLPTVGCFFQNGVVNGGQSYWGNSVTHDNIFSPRPSEVIPAYQHYGNNALIFDGPVVHIGTPCTLTSVTYFTGPDPNTDTYKQHFICQGTGATSGQGATVTTTQPVTAGPCAAGDVAVAYTNTYDVGLYCVSNSAGGCVYGQLYCNVGPIPYNVAAPAPLRLATFNCNQSAVALPVGDYGVMMATNCDTGSVAGAGGVGASAGTGGKPCLTGMGESAPFGGGALNNAFQSGSQLYAWKYFVFTGTQWDQRGGNCLLYDPLHDNTIGLPPSLTAYDNGGCSMVNTGHVKVAPSGQAPHTIGFTWWSML
jgi:uncharacterized protein YjdB